MSFRRLVSIVMLLAACPLALADDAPVLVGIARVLAPETVVISGTRIRFSGVVAPPAEQACAGSSSGTCSSEAVLKLEGWLRDQAIHCTRARRLGHGVYQGVCSLPDGRDLAELLLGVGLLLPAADAPARYRDAVAAAGTAKLGVWGQ